MKTKQHSPIQLSVRRLLSVTAIIAVYLGLCSPDPNTPVGSRPDWGLLFLLTQSRSVEQMLFVLAICVPLIGCMMAPFIRTTTLACIMRGFALEIWLGIGLVLAMSAAC